METFDNFDAAMNTRPDERPAEPQPSQPPQTRQDAPKPPHHPPPVGLPISIPEVHRGPHYGELERFLLRHTDLCREVLELDAAMASASLDRLLDLRRERRDRLDDITALEERLPQIRDAAANEAWLSMRTSLNHEWSVLSEKRVRCTEELEIALGELLACVRALMAIHSEQSAVLDSYGKMDTLVVGRTNVHELQQQHQNASMPLLAWVHGKLRGILPEGVYSLAERPPVDATSIEYRSKAL